MRRARAKSSNAVAVLTLPRLLVTSDPLFWRCPGRLARTFVGIY